MERLTFIEDTHQFFWDGVEVPSVTQILTELGIIKTNFYPSGVAERGKYVHEATVLMDENDLDWDTVPKGWRGYLEAYNKLKAEHSIEWEHREYKFYNKELGYAGIIDGVGFMDGIPTVVDFKTGKFERWHQLQLTGYSMGHCSSRLMGIYLSSDGSYNLKGLSWATAIWNACVELYNWKMRRGIWAK